MKKILLGIGLPLLIILFFACADPAGPDPEDTTAQPSLTSLSASVPSGSWMSYLRDSASLSAITIPGTHDSGSVTEPTWTPRAAKCQNLSIDKQLDSGVRFLDIRCHLKNDAMTIYHGWISMPIRFEDVLNVCSSFLNANWQETIILCVSNEDPDDDRNTNTKSFDVVLKEYIKNSTKPVYTKATIPTLGEARGKMVLMRRFDSNEPYGIPTDGWPKCTMAPIIVQDDYIATDNDQKWNAITKLFDEARNGPLDKMYINFASAYLPSVGGYPDIPSVSDDITPRLTNYFSNSQLPRGRYGIVVLNFIDEEKARLIYMKNFGRL